jgi:hypothetical protein
MRHAAVIPLGLDGQVEGALHDRELTVDLAVRRAGLQPLRSKRTDVGRRDAVQRAAAEGRGQVQLDPSVQIVFRLLAVDLVIVADVLRGIVPRQASRLARDRSTVRDGALAFLQESPGLVVLRLAR